MNNWREQATQIFSLALVLAVASFFCFYQIGQVPPGLFPDEAAFAIDALDVLKGQHTFYSPNEGGAGMLWRYLLALHFAIFGHSILSLRAFAAAVGVFSIGMAYLVVRELARASHMGEENQIPSPLLLTSYSLLPVLAALLQAVSYWHVTQSRPAFPTVLMLLVQDVTFFCLWRALASGHRRWFMLFGLGLGVSVYNYLPGKVIPAVPLIFFLLQWPLARRDALLVKQWRPLVGALGIALVVVFPLLLFALFNYQMLLARAALLTAAVAPMSPWQRIVANLAAFGLWPTLWVSGDWGAFFLGPILTVCFVIGVGVSLVFAIRRRPAYLFLLIWWSVMLLPGALAPEGAVPHVRRSIGAATATFALASLGLTTLIVALFWGIQRLRIALRATHYALRITQVGLGLLLIVWTGVDTFNRYFVLWGPSEEARLDFHVYDLELADLMARQSGAETVYLLPLDSAAGIVNPLLDSITFVYRGQASYDFLPDDEQTILARLSKLTTGKQTVRLLRWKVTKHTGADPKGVAHYYLEKWGRWVGTESFPYFDIETYQLSNAPGAFTPAVLKPTDISFGGQMALAGYAFGAEGERPGESSPPAGDLLWAELAWRKTGDAPTDYQGALWLEDGAGHVVGRVDKPLLNNLRHQGTSQWSVGAEERDYYLLRVDPATSPGTYRLKAVLYAGDNGRRLAPALQPGSGQALSDVGADLAVTLGEAIVRPSLTPPDVAALPIPQRLDLDVGGGLQLLGFEPGFTGSLRPGDRATLSLWWQATKPLTQNLAVAVGMGYGEQAWALNKPQPLGGVSFPTRDWLAGAVVRTFVDVRLPAGVEAGEYNLGLRLLDAESGTSLSDWLLGQVDVVGRARNFEIPPMAHPVGANLGGQVTLLGYDLDLTQVAGGGPVQLILYWQAQREMDTAYKVFVHLLDESGQIAAQVDREPQASQAPTTGWLAGEIVADKIEIPVSGVVATTYSIAVGLYDPVASKRVPVLDPAGAVVSDSVTIPIH